MAKCAACDMIVSMTSSHVEVQSFHGRMEVMRSDHIEALLQDVAHVVGKCKIWSLEEWLVGGLSLQPGIKSTGEQRTPMCHAEWQSRPD